jgi:hypothetical protein
MTPAEYYVVSGAFSDEAVTETSEELRMQSEDSFNWCHLQYAEKISAVAAVTSFFLSYAAAVYSVEYGKSRITGCRKNVLKNSALAKNLIVKTLQSRLI